MCFCPDFTDPPCQLGVPLHTSAVTFNFHTALPASKKQQKKQPSWLIIKAIRFLLNLNGCAKIRDSPPMSGTKLRASHPCKCARWPCSLSRLSGGRCALFEGRAQLRLCPVHVWGALLLMSESPSLCFCSSTLSHLPFSSGSVETALFRLSLTGFATNLLFSSLATSSPPYFSVSVTRTRLTGQ